MDFIKNAIEFVIGTVIVKMIIGHWMANQIMRYSKKWFMATERHMAIWSHYQLRAAGQGHGHANILNCEQDSCAVL